MRDPMPAITVVFVIAIVAFSWIAGRFELAVYALSFWHYLVYALAFLWRKISLAQFKRDSIILKTVSMIALIAVLWTTVPNLVSVIVMAAGFALNIAAAQALGADRTYYGYELDAIQAKRITSFPYSMTAHPMLIGGMLAFGGTLLDETFRTFWWPLGVLHVVLNLAIILNEAYASENRRHGWIVATAALGIGALLLLIGFADALPYALAVTVVTLVFGGVIVRRYA